MVFFFFKADTAEGAGCQREKRSPGQLLEKLRGLVVDSEV